MSKLFVCFKIMSILACFVLHSLSTSFKLVRNKQTCLGIPSPNIYQLEFSVAGENEENIQCRIENGKGEVIQKVVHQRHYQSILNITEENSKICFVGLDSEDKFVSWQLMPLDDPMRSQILQKDLNRLHNDLQKLYLTIEKVYHNQHFYYERNRIHKQKFNYLEVKLKIMKVWKVLLLIFCGALQYFLVHRIVKKRDIGIH